MPGAVTIKFDDLEMKNWMTKAKLTLSRINGVMRSIVAVIGFSDIQDHFRSESGPDGAWAPLKESTLAGRTSRTKWANKKAKGKRTHKILQDTGNLRQSVMPGRGGSQTVSNGIMLYTDVPYANYHDSDEARTRLPQRKFMWISDQGQEKIAQAVLEQVVGK